LIFTTFKPRYNLFFTIIIKNIALHVHYHTRFSTCNRLTPLYFARRVHDLSIDESSIALRNT